MISAQQATQFARKHFPLGPEKLAEYLGIALRESPMKGCDGWCLTRGNRAIIRINSRLFASRKRFTLAHELAHLILGVPTVVGETYEDMLGSDSAEERRVNELASALLLPADVVKSSLPDLPVVADGLKKLAKKAKISQLATAIRVCNLAEEIGLVNASVVLFDDDHVRWQWSKTLEMSNETAVTLLREARRVGGTAYRRQRPDGKAIVASTIENPAFGSATLFVQLLPAELGMNLTYHERRKQLEQRLFKNDERLRQSMSGMMGAHKPRVAAMTFEQAIDDFWERHHDRLQGTTIDSTDGREYVRLRIGEWF